MSVCAAGAGLPGHAGLAAGGRPLAAGAGAGAAAAAAAAGHGALRAHCRRL